MTDQIKVFDPPMCCDTGVCGPDVDPKLTRFAADLDWLKKQGIEVDRFNLAQEPQAFVDHEPIQKALDTSGNDCLPLLMVGDDIISRGFYPTRDQLSSLLSLEPKTADDDGDEADADDDGACCGPSTCC